MRTFINKSFHKSTYKPSYTYSKAAAHCLEFTIHWTYRTNISVVHNLQYQNQSLTLVNQSLVNEWSKRNFSYGNNRIRNNPKNHQMAKKEHISLLPPYASLSSLHSQKGILFLFQDTLHFHDARDRRITPFL